MRNKAYVIDKLMELTGRSESECVMINDILDNHNIIGRNNALKIKEDFASKLNISEKEADDLYNTCASIIVKGIFK